ALPRGDARELSEELRHVARRERSRMRRPRDVRVRLSRENVRVERDRHGLVVLEDALRATEALFELVHVVDDDEALTELGLELWNDVHAVLAHVLERRIADREGRVERDEVDGRNVVELRVGHPAAAELRR